jgi:hypothetical protein
MEKRIFNTFWLESAVTGMGFITDIFVIFWTTELASAINNIFRILALIAPTFPMTMLV